MRSLVLAIRIKKKNLQAVRSTAKDTEHYSQAFKSYNIPEFPKNPLSFSAVKIRQVHEKVPAEPFK